MRKPVICLTMFILSTIAVCIWSANAGTVMVNSAGEVYYPSNFWVRSGAQQMMIDVAESAIATDVPDRLTDYYTKAQANTLFDQTGSQMDAADVLVDRSALTNVTGYTVQQCIESIDALITSSGGGGVTTNTTNIVVNSGTTNASGIYVAFTPDQYSPAAKTVESHLIAINARLGYLLALCTSSVPVTNVQSLTSLLLSGNNLAYENSTSTFSLQATYSDASSADVSEAAAWSIQPPGSAPDGTYVTGKTLTTGPLTWNTSVTVQAEYSYNGQSMLRSTLVQLQDTNPPTLQSVALSGAAAIAENQTATYTAYALYDQGISNNVTDSATWGFNTGVPEGTAYTNGNAVLAGSVFTNTSIGLTAQFGGKTGTKSVTISNTEQHLLFTINNSTLYHSGTLYLYGYDNAGMQGWPLYQHSFAYSPAMFGAFQTNLLSTAIRQFGTGQHNGQSYWFAFLDTDANGFVNGTVASTDSTIPNLRTDEPATIMDGQTASGGCLLSQNQASSLTFTLESLSSSFSYITQGYPADGLIRKYIAIGDADGNSHLCTVITNRAFLCEQDFLVNSESLSGTATYRLYIYNQDQSGNNTYPGYYGWFNN